MSGGADTPLARLLRRLDLTAEAGDVFRAAAGSGAGRLFGGLVAAQSVVAAGRSLSGDFALHSLHAYFLRAGRADGAIRFEVARTRDGRRFASRRVIATQGDRPIFEMIASFTRAVGGFAHQDPAPVLPPPDGLEDWERVRARLATGSRARMGFEAFDVRVVEPERDAPGAISAATRSTWMRARGEVPVDPLLASALVVYASDRALLRCAGRPHALEWAERPPASLDHAVWLHGPPRIGDWFVYDCRSPAAHAGRGLAIGAMYARSGERFASVAQEGLLEP
jgi:acyl-CoA thioesterase-2